MRPGVPDVHITDRQDEQYAAYRALSAQAVLALICGLLSPLAFIDVLLWAFPILGVVLGWRSLRCIKRNYPALTGSKIAWTGLCLSLLFLVAAPCNWLAYRWFVQEEAKQFAAEWFDYLTHDEPEKAYQLTVGPQVRQPLDENLWAIYRNNPRLREEFESYVAGPLVRTLLALGPRAQVRFYDTAGQSHSGENDNIALIYAVTYEEGAERKSFFVSVPLMRMKLKDGSAGWRVMGAEGGIKPEGWD